jgi:tRNA pseudouridine55 synthase
VTQTESVATTVLEALATFQGTGVVSPLLAEALEKERARVEQVPPAVSAIKIDGQRAHELVRRGTVPTMAPRSVHVLQMTLVASGMADATSPWPWLDVHVRASKGYYVRSLGRDLASHLGTVGHLTALRRVRSGEFSLDEAVASHAPPDHLRQRILSLTAAATRCLSHCTLDDASVVAAQRGQKVPLPPTAPKSGPAAWLDGSGNLVAIGETLAESSTALGRVLRGFRPIPATASPAQIAREGMGHGAGPHPERETERETEHEPVREYGDASSETPETSPRH